MSTQLKGSPAKKENKNKKDNHDEKKDAKWQKKK